MIPVTAMSPTSLASTEVRWILENDCGLVQTQLGTGPDCTSDARVISWLEQINIALGASFAGTDMTSSFSQSPSKRKIETALLHLGQTTVYIYSLARGMSSLSHLLSKYSPEKPGPPGHPAKHHIGPLYWYVIWT